MESISVLDMFKIGIGPSSSHTLGPWKAALRYLDEIKEQFDEIERLEVQLFGSLAKTGKGHGSDIALMLGLSGEDPVEFDIEQIDPTIQTIKKDKRLKIGGIEWIDFNPENQIHFISDEIKPYHPNAMTFLCRFKDTTLYKQTYFSVGGGFVVQEGEEDRSETADIPLPYPIDYASDLSIWCKQTGLPISGVVAENEKEWRSEEETEKTVLKIWEVMSHCIYRGCHTEGYLPGGLQVMRRASILNKRLLNNQQYDNYHEWRKAIRNGGDDFAYILDWVSCFALAVNEENAAFSRVVTAPTNGASGVIPAVLQYLVTFKRNLNEDIGNPVSVYNL